MCLCVWRVSCVDDSPPFVCFDLTQLHQLSIECVVVVVCYSDSKRFMTLMDNLKMLPEFLFNGNS